MHSQPLLPTLQTALISAIPTPADRPLPQRKRLHNRRSRPLSTLSIRIVATCSPC